MTRMPRLIGVCTGRKGHFVGFVMRRRKILKFKVEILHVFGPSHEKTSL